MHVVEATTRLGLIQTTNQKIPPCPPSCNRTWPISSDMRPLGVVEDLREAVDLVLGVRVQCLLGCGVLMEEPVLGGLEHGGRVAGEGDVRRPDRGDSWVACVGHGVAEVADGFVGEFMLRIPLVLLGDVLLPVDVLLLPVRSEVGYLRPPVVYVVAELRGAGVVEGRQLLLCIPEVMEHVSQGRGWLLVLGVEMLLEAAGNSGCAHGCELVGGVHFIQTSAHGVLGAIWEA